MRQPVLWDQAVRRRAPAPPWRAHAVRRPCPGCGAKPGAWKPGRFAAVLAAWGYVPLCGECARIPEVMLAHIREFAPDPPRELCPWPAGSDERIDDLAGRRERLEALGHADDACHSLPAVRKPAVGAPDHQAAPGETGVELCGDKFRVRPFWRGRKWPLGVFLWEDEARERARAFWRVHGPDALPPPVLWLPTGDEDGAIPVEPEHLKEWRADYPKVNARRVAREFRAELRAGRDKPPTVEVWRELLRRLAAAAGPTLFGHLLAGADESADYLMGA